jgi:hypothetical protein
MTQSYIRVKPSLYPSLGRRVRLTMASSTLARGVKLVGVRLDPLPNGLQKQGLIIFVGGTVPP